MIDYLILGVASTLLILQIVGRVRIAPKRGIVIDSCGLIDGRIEILIEVLPFIGQIIIPSYVLDELQSLADGKDALKRQRAREGLDTANRLIKLKVAKLLSVPKKYLETDHALRATCLDLKAVLYTTDLPLQSVASAHGINVLNPNTIAAQLRTRYAVGDTITVFISDKGKEYNQAIGYSDDGALVYVEKASKFIGTRQKICIVHATQTAGGVAFFARLQKTQ